MQTNKRNSQNWPSGSFFRLDTTFDLIRTAVNPHMSWNHKAALTSVFSVVFSIQLRFWTLRSVIHIRQLWKHSFGVTSFMKSLLSMIASFLVSQINGHITPMHLYKYQWIKFCFKLFIDTYHKQSPWAELFSPFCTSLGQVKHFFLQVCSLIHPWHTSPFTVTWWLPLGTFCEFNCILSHVTLILQLHIFSLINIMHLFHYILYLMVVTR